MNNQEIFDKVAKHLLTQNKVSRPEDDRHACLYRGHDGLMCAVGCLIPDELYTTDIEYVSMADVIHETDESAFELKKIFDAIGIHPTSYNLLSTLQLIHDDKPVEDWKYELMNLAKSENLEWNIDGR